MSRTKARIVYKRGFTMMELMLAAAILAFTLAGLLATYVAAFVLNETSRNLTLAIATEQKILEEIRDSVFDDIQNDYDFTTSGYTFTIDGIGSQDSIGRVDVDLAEGTVSDPELWKVTITACWRQRGERIIGEDRNLNGILDTGEDADADGNYDSPAQLITYIARR